MSFDLNIISFGQKRISKFRNNLNIKVLNEIDDYDGARYCDIFPFMCKVDGIWYSAVVDQDGILDSVPICGSNWDLPYESLPIPYWVTNDLIKDELTQLYIKEPYKEEFKEILETLIEDSPEKTILFQSRYQCYECEIIQGVLSLEDFFDKLEEGKILFNVCYIIRKEKAIYLDGNIEELDDDW